MAKRLTTLGILTSMSLTFFLLEGLLPINFFPPGAKLGLSNVVTVFALYKFEKKSDALIILLLRNFLSVIFSGSPTIIFFSLSGGLLSLAVMTFLQYTEKFSIIGVSATGGFFHNLGQIFAAMIFISSREIFNYLTILGICGIFTGILIGLITKIIIRRLQ